MRPRRSFWQFTASEARAHAVTAAVVLWAIAIFVLAFGSTYRDPFGHVKWTDFVHFYTLGHLVQHGPVDHLYDAAAQHLDQVTLVPPSEHDWYFPVYPPQIALVFGPVVPPALSRRRCRVVARHHCGLRVRHSQLYALLLFPTAKLIALQASTLVILWMTCSVWRAAVGPGSVTEAASAPAAPLLAADSGPR